MALPIKTKLKAKRKGAVKRVSKGTGTKGISVKDLVGTIQVTQDPVTIQRRMRDEWE